VFPVPVHKQVAVQVAPRVRPVGQFLQLFVIKTGMLQGKLSMINSRTIFYPTNRLHADRPGYLTETAILQVLMSFILQVVDEGDVAALTLLELDQSAACDTGDTVDHGIVYAPTFTVIVWF